ncbi:MAG: exodeoxyribonuclease VII large subunit [Candidatus Margulisiibacteriota bacterium]
MTHQPVYSVSQLNNEVKNALRQLSFQGLWIKGEVLDYKVQDGGRYARFILGEKDQGSNNIIAQVPAVCWGNELKAINSKLQLQNGTLVQLKCMLDMWVQAGRFQVVVKDIEPSFTLGELHFLRGKIFSQLKEAGLHEKNKMVKLPLCPLKVALITSRGCAGYNDFLSEIKNSKYPFEIDFYHAVVQGPAVETEIVEAIKATKGKYDAVVIVRGGGAVTDLKWFDNLKIGKAIANCPNPVLTGIGHEINLTVADMVAHSNFKTPTAAGAFLVNMAGQFVQKLNSVIKDIHELSKDSFERAQQGLFDLVEDIDVQAGFFLKSKKDEMSLLYRDLSSFARNFLFSKEEELKHLSEKINIFDPINTLKLGYSVTRDKNGKAVKQMEQVAVGDELLTQVTDGAIYSTILIKEKTHG